MATAFFGVSDVTTAPAVSRAGVASAASHGQTSNVALSDVYATFGPKVRRFCASSLGVELADDALQETFARAYRIEPKPPCGEWVPWLYGTKIRE